MFIIKDWKKDVFTIPNILSVFRLLLIPVYLGLYLKAGDDLDMHLFAAGVLGLSCLTDAVDGLIARRFNMISTLGKILDPLADKATQFSLILCLAGRYAVLWHVVALFLLKELFQMVSGMIFLQKGKMLNGALMVGKICTTVLFVSLILMVLVPTLPYSLVRGLAAVDCLFLAASFAGYFMAYYGKNAKIADQPEK